MHTRIKFIMALCGMGALCFYFVVPALAYAAGGIEETTGNWAGYAATGEGFTSVSGNWVVPSVPASLNATADAAWVGIGGIASRDLIQAGTQAIAQNGVVSYEAWYETLPQNSIPFPLSVHAGDSVHASITQSGSAGEWLITLTDQTTGQSASASVAYNSSENSAEWIEEMPSDQVGYIPLDAFGSVSFSNASAVENGSTVTPLSANAFPLSMDNSMGQVLAAPSALGADGESFGISRTAAEAIAIPRVVELDGRGGFRRGGAGGGYVPRQVTRIQSIPTAQMTSFVVRLRQRSGARLF